MRDSCRRVISVPLLPLLLLLGGLPACTPEVTGPVGHDPHHEEDTHEEETGLTLDPEAIVAAGIEVAPARTMDMPEFLETTGVVSANQTRLAHIRPLSSGIVREVHVQEGDRIVEDQALLAYDNVQLGELVRELDALQARLRSAQAREEAARKLWERGRELYAAEAIPERELELRTAEHRSSQETVGSHRAEIARTVEKLRRFGATDEQLRGGLDGDGLVSVTVLRAPFSGTVIGYEVAPGEVLSPDRVVLTVADLSEVWVLADVYERDLAVVAAGQEVEITTPSYPERVFPARVTYVGDQVDPRTRTVKVRCLAANPGSLLKLGMFATLRIHRGSARAVTAVPASAIQTLDPGVVVFVRAENDRFEPRTVRTGAAWQGWVAIEEGLAAGEPVVTRGAFSLKSELSREALGGGHAH